MAAKPVPFRTRSGVRWRVRFRIPPDANPKSESFDTQAEAAKFARLVDQVGGAAAREMRQASAGSDQSVPTLATYVQSHLERLASSATPGTVADYARLAARTFLTQLGTLPIDQVTRDSVVKWIAWQRAQEVRTSLAARARAERAGVPPPAPVTYSVKSIANAQRFFSTVLAAAVDDEAIPSVVKNVARGVALPSDQSPEEKVFLSESEFARLFAAVPVEHQSFVALLAGTGMRWGEATALTPAMFELDASTPTVRVERAWKKAAQGVYLGTPKTKRGRRTITLPRSVVEAVRPQVEAATRDALVFAARDGGRLRAQNWHPRVWRPAVAASGIEKRPRVHDLRHSHVSWLIAAGVPLTVIQRRLGHESIQTTSDVYGHLAADIQGAAALAAEISLASALPQLEG